MNPLEIITIAKSWIENSRYLSFYYVSGEENKQKKPIQFLWYLL